jgi:hypothetical protein
MLRKGSRSRHIAIAFVIIFSLLVIATFAATVMTGRSATASGSPVVKHTSTITLSVTGHRSDVTYNNGYRAIQTKGPFAITLPLQSDRNYTITTFNLKPGDSACTIKIGSKVVASHKALGQGDTAGCVVVQNKTTHALMPSTW